MAGLGKQYSKFKLINLKPETKIGNQDKERKKLKLAVTQTSKCYQNI